MTSHYSVTIRLKRAYDLPSPDDGYRILVERLWPRGLSRASASIDAWSKDTAPSSELRQWFDHDPEKWAEFKHRYFKELGNRPTAVEVLLQAMRSQTVTFVYASKEERFNNAVALREYLEANGLAGSTDDDGPTSVP